MRRAFGGFSLTTYGSLAEPFGSSGCSWLVAWMGVWSWDELMGLWMVRSLECGVGVAKESTRQASGCHHPDARKAGSEAE